jgi:hypothetical protein
MRFKPEDRRGAHHHASKLDQAAVLEIRRRYDTKESPRSIAASFGVAASRIIEIGKRRSWGWLPESAEKATVQP